MMHGPSVIKCTFLQILLCFKEIDTPGLCIIMFFAFYDLYDI